jgi:outer membrane murein-binding lipoprotein Lpp
MGFYLFAQKVNTMNKTINPAVVALAISALSGLGSSSKRDELASRISPLRSKDRTYTSTLPKCKRKVRKAKNKRASKARRNK